jgi:hypothetical protein
MPVGLDGAGKSGKGADEDWVAWLSVEWEVTVGGYPGGV